MLMKSEARELRQIRELSKGTPVKIRRTSVKTGNVKLYGVGTPVVTQLGIGRAFTIVDAKIKVWLRDKKAKAKRK